MADHALELAGTFLMAVGVLMALIAAIGNHRRWHA